MKRETKRIATAENWYPTNKNGTVQVSLMQLYTAQWRVCVWGDDDFGLERYFDARDEAMARLLFDHIQDSMTQETMRQLGMVNA
jgi:hypothetical protein